MFSCEMELDGYIGVILKRPLRACVPQVRYCMVSRVPEWDGSMRRSSGVDKNP